MKKFVFAAILSALVLGGCTSTEVKTSGIERKITWEHVGNLPAQKGFEKNIGTVNQLIAQWLIEMTETIDRDLFARAIEIKRRGKKTLF